MQNRLRHSGLGLGYGRVFDGVVSWTPPFKSDVLAGGDGTIITIGADKYLKDLKSGKHLLITGYDFDSTWTKGFPYKSAATISAPAGDAAFIAADLNNFWYDSGGTPNQIPVVSLFQNIDYNGKFFFLHAAQVLNGDGVETYEPRVIEWAIYSTVKTGADLITCNTYYSVPTIDANAKWIDPVNGVDATGNGSQSLPYKTHSKVNGLTLTEGTQVYVKTGTFAPIAISKNYNYKGIGFVKILSSTQGRGIDWDPQAGKTLPQTIEGYIINMNNVANSTCVNSNLSGYDLILKRIYGYNYAIGFLSGHGNLNKITKENCVLINGATDYSINSDANNDIINLFTTGGAYGLYSVGNYHKIKNIINSKISLALTGRIYYEKDLNIIGSVLNLTTGALFSMNTTTTGYWRFIKTKINLLTAGETVFISLEDIRLLSVEFDGCEFRSESDQYVGLRNQPIITYKNNVIHLGNNNSGLKLMIESTDLAVSSVFVVENNVFNSNSTKGSLAVGTEPSITNKNKDEGIITKNRFRILGQSHGCMIMNRNKVVCTYNYLFGGTSLPMGFKSTDPDDYSASIAAYNVIIDGTLLSKGCHNLRFYNNTIVYNNYNINGPDNIDITINNATTVEGNKVKNNIMIYTDSVQRSMIRLDHENNEIDYNIYYCSQTELTFNYKSSTITFAEWQALGYDLHSIVLTTEQFNNLFTDFENGDYSLKAGSVAIGAGVTLDAAYDDGLDASTNWGTDSQVPVVVTKQQGVAWDIGAYVH